MSQSLRYDEIETAISVHQNDRQNSQSRRRMLAFGVSKILDAEKSELMLEFRLWLVELSQWKGLGTGMEL